MRHTEAVIVYVDGKGLDVLKGTHMPWQRWAVEYWQNPPWGPMEWILSCLSYILSS